jgi:hypothetical protein
MGALVNKRITTILAAVFIVVILSLNAFFLYFSLGGKGCSGLTGILRARIVVLNERERQDQRTYLSAQQYHMQSEATSRERENNARDAKSEEGTHMLLRLHAPM